MKAKVRNNKRRSKGEGKEGERGQRNGGRGGMGVRRERMS